MTNKTVTWHEFEEILSDNKPHTFAIALNGGAYSKKTITLNKPSLESYEIINHIDDTTQNLTLKEIQNLTSEHTNIGKAIEKHALYLMEE